MSKTPGGQQPSEKYLKQEASTQGLGSHTEDVQPLKAPVAGASGDSNVGITEINNQSAGKSGGLNTEGAFGTTQVGPGAPTANIPPEQVDTKKNA